MVINTVFAWLIGVAMVCYIAWMIVQYMTRKRDPDDGSDVSGFGR